jgi:hypothetical protein
LYILSIQQVVSDFDAFVAVVEVTINELIKIRFESTYQLFILDFTLPQSFIVIFDVTDLDVILGLIPGQSDNNLFSSIIG